jgi:uncharacterized RDD family membrane protein YckC
VTGRDFSLGLAVLGFRAGIVAGRVVVFPIRVATHIPVARSLVTTASVRVSRSGEHARAAAQARAEDAVGSALTGPELERMLDRALTARLPDTVVRKLVDQVLASPEIDRVVEHVAASPAVRAAVTQQSSGFAVEIATRLRERAARLDDVADARARALLHRPARIGASPYGGIVTRTVAFSIDLVLVATTFLVVAALAGLTASLVSHHLGRWPVVILVSVSWSLAVALYFIFFWTTAGQTPGMRVMGQHVTRTNGQALGAGRAALRFVILTLALVALLASAILVLFDERRRGLHDVLAATVVTRS